MAKKKAIIPQYGTVTRCGVLYYRTRIMDADGKQMALYATTCEELYKKEQEARRDVEDLIFRRKNPTVAEYCEKWLYMKSATISASTLRGYTNAVNLTDGLDGLAAGVSAPFFGALGLILCIQKADALTSAFYLL